MRRKGQELGRLKLAQDFRTNHLRLGSGTITVLTRDRTVRLRPFEVDVAESIRDGKKESRKLSEAAKEIFGLRGHPPVSEDKSKDNPNRMDGDGVIDGS